MPKIVVQRNGREFSLPGSGGVERELAFLPSVEEFPGPRKEKDFLPVLIGSGVGAALAEIVRRLEDAYGRSFTLAVVDKEEDISAQSRLEQRFSAYPGIRWLDSPDPAQTINELTRLQIELGGAAFLPLLNPLYLRLDRIFYAQIQAACTASARVNLWSRMRYAKFKDADVRILMLTSKYFLMGEILSACERMGVQNRLLQVPEGGVGRNEFIEQFLALALEFKPDFVFTINHLGVDREGVLTDLLEKLRLPLASWFVDNPHLILYLYPRLKSSWTALFTWDADNIASLRDFGFEHVHYLPLGTDLSRFQPLAAASPATFHLPSAWDGRISFVGNSMVHKVMKRKERSRIAQPLLDAYKEVALGFMRSNEHSVSDFLAGAFPKLMEHFNNLPDTETRLHYETTITWEATRVYRLSCIQAMLPFNPLIAGDDGWFNLLPDVKKWHYHHELNYYSDLPLFYPRAAINFNSTSMQMKGAVNQRVFDVPATASFLLTDYRKQMENLFEPGREIICYHSPDEATHLVREYLARPSDRVAVTEAARRRIISEHSYEHRVTTLLGRMREIYG